MLSIVRANRALNNLGYSAYRTLTYDGGSVEARAAEAIGKTAIAEVKASLQKAERLAPRNAAKYREFENTADALTPLAADAIKLAMANRNDEAKSLLQRYDEQTVELTIAMKKFNDVTDAEIIAKNKALIAAAHQTVWMNILLSVAGIALGLAAGVWIATAKISRPLNALASRMRVLAAGDLDVAVDGQERGDEVGLMAKAVQVFKDNGLKARDLGLDADRLRAEADSEQGRTEAERRAVEAEQAIVVQTLAASLGRLAQGDLTSRIDAEFKGQYLQIKTDFNEAIDSLREAMGAISAATGGIRGGSDEIASASDDLSKRTEQQAASLEETAAALDQITATVKRSADGARQLSTAAAGAKVEAARSGEVMRDAILAMGEIEQSSDQITQIIGVIDEIAFQTNLLALNAGVEAARAGDAGRGFAVVAQEVRALAQRSAEAAKEIKTLIASSTSQVERGVNLVGDTGQALTSIAAKITEIDTLISEIAKSAQEQAAGLNQVNIAVNQMDQVTQQNAAMVEQATAAASNLKTEASELARLVARFQTGETALSRGRPELAQPGRHASAGNPVAQVQSKLAAFVRLGGGQTTT